MATKRQGRAKRATGKKRTGSRSGGTTRPRRPTSRASSGARAAKREEAALELDRSGPRLVPLPPADPDEASPTSDQAAEWRSGSEAEETPWVEHGASLGAQASGTDGSGWMGAGAASHGDRWAEAQAELTRRREEEEAHPGPWGTAPGLPGIAVEIAIGALRLARTILTAPLRLALAFLRPREA